MGSLGGWSAWPDRAWRHPSAVLLTVQLLGVLLYPFMDRSALGRSALALFGVGVLFLAVAWLTDARDLRPLLATVTRRLRRRRPAGGDDGPPAQQHPGERGDGRETVSS